MWYVQLGEHWRPASDDQLRDMVGMGTVRRETWIRHETWEHPAPAGSAPFLRDYFSPAPAVGAPSSTATAKPKPKGTIRLKHVLMVVGVVIASSVAVALAWGSVAIGVFLVVFVILAGFGKVPLPKRFGAERRKKNMGLVSAAACGVWIASCGALGVSANREAARKEEQKAAVHAAKAREAELAARALEERRAKAPAVAAAWKKELDEALASAQQGEARSALERARKVEEVISSEQRELGAPPVAAISDAAQHLRNTVAEIEAYVQVIDAVESIPEALERAKTAVSARMWLAADAAYEEVLSKVEYLQGLGAPLSAQVPEEFDLVTKRRQAEAGRRRIAGAVATEKRRIEREKAKEAKAEEERKEKERQAAAYRAVCGEEPVRSGWDGEIVGLEAHIGQFAHDPGSIDVENCTKPVLSKDSCWVFTCQVRGKNAFGALVMNQHVYAKSVAGFEQLK